MVVEGERKGSHIQGRSFIEVLKVEISHSSNKIWLDVGESLLREAMGRLKFCLVGSWKNPPGHLPVGFGVGSLGPYNMEIEAESHGGVMIEPTISNAQVNKFSSMYSLFQVTSKHKENSKVQAPLPQLQGSLIISFMPPHLYPPPQI